jgi:hypothetical protein
MLNVYKSAFSSFPDSLQFDQGSQVHSFRIRDIDGSTEAQSRPTSKDGFIYGYSYFTQRRDANSKRGYQQVKGLFKLAILVITNPTYSAIHRHSDTPTISCLIFKFGNQAW